MKKFIQLLLIVTLVVSVTGCNKTEKEKTDAERFKEEYESINNTTRKKDNKTIRTLEIPAENPMVYKTAEEISQKMDDKETFIVYFGFRDCPWCRSVIEELIKAGNDNSVGKIYYVDVKDIRDVKEIDEEGNITTSKEGSDGYKELLEKMGNVLEDYTLQKNEKETVSAEEKRIYAPNVVAVANGEAIKLTSGESESLKDPYQKLTKEMRKETYEKFECLIKCLEKENKTCQKKSC